MAGTGPAGAVEHPAAAPRVTGAPTGDRYTPTSPTRVLDTRNGTGAAEAPVGAGASISVSLSGAVPVAATAVVLTVTGVNATLGTYVTAWPDQEARPTASNLNLAAGETRAGSVTVELGPDRAVDLYNFHGQLDLVADLAGYYAPAAGGGFSAISPAVRALDTRTTGGPVGANTTRVLDLSGAVPAGATAATLNVTGLDATLGTYVTVFGDQPTRPLASDLNLAPGAITANQVTVDLTADRKIDLYNFQGGVDLVVDLTGYYAPGTGQPFWPMAPTRVLDTRAAGGGGPAGAGQDADTEQWLWIPQYATGVVMTLTGTDTTANTYLTAWLHYDASSRPGPDSSLNLAAGQTAANLVVLGDVPDFVLSARNFAGSVDVIMDVAGYFAPPPAACTSGCVDSWGDNSDAQLGNGTSGGYSAQPGQVPGISGATAVTAGEVTGYAITGSGTVASWGGNDLGQLGASGYEQQGPAVVAQQVESGAAYDTSAIAADGRTGYAIAGTGADTDAIGWGDNADGQIGYPDIPFPIGPWSSLPWRTDLPGTPVKLAAGAETGYALQSDGTVWSWGRNAGLLGTGSYGTGCDTEPAGSGCVTHEPVQVTGLTDVVAIAANTTDAYALTADGQVWAWGEDDRGQLGQGVTGPVATAPVKVPGLTGIGSLAAGGATAYALPTAGGVLAWGADDTGQLGAGVVGGYAAVPVAVTGLTGVRSVAAGRGFALALRTDGTVASWGENDRGQLGQGASGPAAGAPQSVPGLTGVTAIGAGARNGYAIVG
ncbi:MAG TPA: hypothetical protein VG756_05615 [Pseudonocardiaceae bacterium]|nr:hypothetical protein [Pseudonocardiaceae bacterium]